MFYSAKTLNANPNCRRQRTVVLANSDAVDKLGVAAHPSFSVGARSQGLCVAKTSFDPDERVEQRRTALPMLRGYV